MVLTSIDGIYTLQISNTPFIGFIIDDVAIRHLCPRCLLFYVKNIKKLLTFKIL